MDEIKVQTKSQSYPVKIGSNIISYLPKLLNELHLSPTKIMVVTDNTVESLFGENLKITLAEIPVPSFIHVIKSGEASKSFDNYYEGMTVALTNQLDRKSLMIAFGGGVVGDLTGFLAATYMRGIPFIQIPTTLLAHDSAVGGKVAINHPLGKNMIGAFHQPDAVLFDTEFLKTLPITEVRSGFAEVVKHGFIQDPQFVKWLIDNISNLQELKEEELHSFIKKGIEIKAKIVSEDEKEAGKRAFLNFGHTLGHAIESVLGYGGISHGDAVATGMLFAIYLSEKQFSVHLGSESIRKWFHQIGFPTTIPKEISTEDLYCRMKNDKKTVNNQIRMVLLKSIGEPTIKTFDDQTIYHHLNQWRMEWSD